MKLILFVLLMILVRFELNTVCAGDVCEYEVTREGKMYRYKLASHSRSFPHGVLSEDGFYKVAANDTIIWFQLCAGMIFNHDPPTCVDCPDCGGSSRCGMGCSAIVANNIGGYYACTSIGRDSSFDIELIDQKSPHKGVRIKISNSSQKANCSLSVSVMCDSDGVKGPQSFEKLGVYDYGTVLQHPSGCPKIISVSGKGWGWFGILFFICLGGLGAYLLACTIYRFFFLGIRGLDVIPNLDFWTSIPHRTKGFFMYLVQRIRGPTYHHTSSYSPVNF